MRPLVYLCGPMSGLTLAQAKEWRTTVTRQLGRYGIGTLDPCRQSTDDTLVMDNFGVEGNPLLTGKALVTSDRNDIRRCDMVLANFLNAKKPGIGSSIEFGWADAFGKPIVMVMEESGNPFDHAFTRELAGFHVTNLADAVHVVLMTLNRTHIYEA